MLQVRRLLLVGSLAVCTALALPAFAQQGNYDHDRSRWGWSQDRDHDHDRDYDHDRDRDRDRDRHDRYGRNGRGGYGNSAASRMGYQDGLMYGRNDASRGKGFNATGSNYYQHGDHGYNSSYGDKNYYRQQYRQAYQQGYQQGYNQSRGGRRY